MSDDLSTSAESLLEAVRRRDSGAVDELLRQTADRLMRLTQKMLNEYPKLHRWVQVEDVHQNALVRIHRALGDVQPRDESHYFNLAALAVRRELLDLVRHYFGSEGLGANHQTGFGPPDEKGGLIHGKAAQVSDEKGWAQFHEFLQQLSAEDQEVISLTFYEGLTADAAAARLGISPRTLKRRLSAARTRLKALVDKAD